MSGTDYTANLTLSYSGNVPKQTVKLTQTVQGSLPQNFAMDSLGRISIPAAGGSISVSVTLTMNRSTTAGATGNLWLCGVDSAAPLFSEPPDLIQPLNSGGNAKATLQWSGANLLNRSLEVDLEFTGQPGVQVASGQITIVLHVEETHSCTTYDLGTGMIQHRQPVRLFLDMQTPGTFPLLYWCQWCHQMFVQTTP